MKEYKIHLLPTSNFEIMFHSDTLFGAICWAIFTLFGENKLIEILEEFKESPPFLLSSAFPFKQTRKKRYYLPKPYMEPLTAKKIKSLKNKLKLDIRPYHNKEKLYLINLITKYKQFKKIKWIPASIFKKIQKGTSEEEVFCDFLDGILKSPNFIESQIVQKNRLDRLSFSTTGDGEVFYNNELSFKKNWGLYFLLKTDENKMEEYLKPALLYIQDSGIGPNARTGKNWFNIEIEDGSLLETTHPTNTFITLSRYIGSEEINIEKSWYEIEAVRSKVESKFDFYGKDIWKAQVMYFSAGSIINVQEKKSFYGELIPVKKIKGKTIYQYGYAYPVYI